MVRQYIDESAIAAARREVPIRWSLIAEDTYLRSYSRIKPDGTEEDWYETCARVVNGNCSFVPERFIEPGEPERLYRMMLELKLLPAGRHLWVTGALSDKVFLANCHCADFTERFSEHFEYVFSRLMEGGGVGANYSVRHIQSRSGNRPWIPQRQVNVHILIRSDHKDIDRPMILEPVDQAPVGFLNEKGVPCTSLRHLRTDRYSEHWSGNGSRLTANRVADLIDQLLQHLQSGNPSIYLQVEDSREGWALALVALLEASVAQAGPREVDLIFDLNLIREFGAPLRTFGGTASGPGALALMLARIGNLLNARLDSPLSGLDCMLIDHYIACCVVSGGARRSARMAMKYWQDPDILEFIRIKRPQKMPDGEDFYPHHTTNISVVVDNKFLRALKRGQPTAQQVLNEVVEGMLYWRGEPGLINASRCLQGEAPGTEFYSTNPCVTEETLILTEQGIYPVRELIGVPFEASLESKPARSNGFFQTGVQPVYEVLTEEGSRIEVTADHRLLIAGETEDEWRRVCQLEVGTPLVMQGVLQEQCFRHVAGLMELIAQVGSETQDGTEFVWIPDEPTARYWKSILNLLGIQSRLAYRESVSAWSLRIDKSDMKRLRQAIRSRSLNKRIRRSSRRWIEHVRSVRAIGDRPVYDCTVDREHCYLSNGFVSHNCGEIAFVRYPDLRAFDVCNLGHVNLARIEHAQEMEEAFRLMTRFLIRATFAPQSDEKMTRSIERNRRIGVGFLGYHTWLVLNGIRYSEAPESEQVRSCLKRWYSVVRDTARQYCMQLRIPECIKVTAVAPTGTVGTVAEVSTGIQPVFSPHRFYLRRIVYNANDKHPAQKFALELMIRYSQYDPEEQQLVLESLLPLAEELKKNPTDLRHLSWLTAAFGSLPEPLQQRAAEDARQALRDSVGAVGRFVRLVGQRQAFRVESQDEQYLHLYLEPHPTKENHYIATYIVADPTVRMLMTKLLQSGEATSEQEAIEMSEALVESQYELEPRHFLANLRMVQELFADNAISNTINVDPDVVTPEQLKQQILEYLPYLKGVTVMPVYRGKDAPLQRISPEQVVELLEQGIPLSVVEPEDECNSGACPVR